MMVWKETFLGIYLYHSITYFVPPGVSTSCIMRPTQYPPHSAVLSSVSLFLSSTAFRCSGFSCCGGAVSSTSYEVLVNCVRLDGMEESLWWWCLVSRLPTISWDQNQPWIISAVQMLVVTVCWIGYPRCHQQHLTQACHLYGDVQIHCIKFYTSVSVVHFRWLDLQRVIELWTVGVKPQSSSAQPSSFINW